MKNKYFSAFFYLFFDSKCTAKQTKDTLQEVVITSSRIDLPFKENSRTIQLITAEDIKNRVTNVADALQQIAGIDVRRQD
jgi:iron complex outermembrane receptor protein